MSKPPPPAPTASAIGPCPTVIKIVGRPGTGSLPSTIAPPDHPLFVMYSTDDLTLAFLIERQINHGIPRASSRVDYFSGLVTFIGFTCKLLPITYCNDPFVSKMRFET